MEQLADHSNHGAESMRNRVRRAVIWRSGSQIAAQMVQWTATFVVIRILTPADYGLFAMTGVVLAFLNLFAGYGLASGLIRQAEVDARTIRQLFGMLLVLNGALALLQVALAPVAAAYYRAPIIAQLLTVQALLYLPTPFIAVASALLARRLDYSHQGRSDMTAALAGAGISVVGATAGWGVWTLVVAPMMLFAIRAILLTRAIGGPIRPSFDFRGAGALARFGGLMAAGQLFWFAQNQIDVLVGGRLLSAHALGLYTTSLFLVTIFVAKFVPAFNEVSFAAYAKMQHDRAAAAGGFLTAARLVTAVGAPFYAGLAVTAEPVVATILGPQWLAAAPIVRVLACAMPLMTLQVMLAPACDAQGRPGIGLRNGASGALLLGIAFLIGVQWGAMGLAWAWVAAYPIHLALSLRRALPVIGATPGALLATVVRPLGAAVAMALLVHALDGVLPALEAPLRLALLAAAGVTAYIGLLALVAQPLLREIVALTRR